MIKKKWNFLTGIFEKYKVVLLLPILLSGCSDMTNNKSSMSNSESNVIQSIPIDITALKEGLKARRYQSKESSEINLSSSLSDQSTTVTRQKDKTILVNYNSSSSKLYAYNNGWESSSESISFEKVDYVAFCRYVYSKDKDRWVWQLLNPDTLEWGADEWPYWSSVDGVPVIMDKAPKEKGLVTYAYCNLKYVSGTWYTQSWYYADIDMSIFDTSEYKYIVDKLTSLESNLGTSLLPGSEDHASFSTEIGLISNKISELESLDSFVDKENYSLLTDRFLHLLITKTFDVSTHSASTNLAAYYTNLPTYISYLCYLGDLDFLSKILFPPLNTTQRIALVGSSYASVYSGSYGEVWDVNPISSVFAGSIFKGETVTDDRYSQILELMLPYVTKDTINRFGLLQNSDTTLLNSYNDIISAENAVEYMSKNGFYRTYYLNGKNFTQAFLGLMSAMHGYPNTYVKRYLDLYVKLHDELLKI